MPAAVISTVNDSVATKYQKALPADHTVNAEIKAGVRLYAYILKHLTSNLQCNRARCQVFSNSWKYFSVAGFMTPLRF